MPNLISCRMRVLATATALVLSSLIALPAAARSNAHPNLTALESGEYDGFLVKYRQSSLSRTQRGASLRKSLAASARLSGVAGLSLNLERQLAIGAEWVKPSRKLDPVQAAQLMRAFRLDPNVEYVVPNRIAYVTAPSTRPAPNLAKPNDPQYAQQWGLNPTAGVNAERAWDITRGAGVVVAVIDTGITPHTDLAANVLPGYDFISSSGNAGDSNGRDDDPTDKPGAGDFHGTHVSGISAAVGNNGKGVAGVAYEAKILPVRALGVNGGGTWADIFDAMVWAAGGEVSGVPKNANPAEVINMSLSATGADPCDQATKDVIKKVHDLGTTIVVAAGNSGADVARETPANCEAVITAGAVTSTGARAGYSAWGTFVDVGAPGSSVLSTHWASSGEGYTNKSGTSMASPHVAGVVALMQAAVSKPLTPDQVQQALKAGARKYPTPPDKPIGVGYADAVGAISEACKLVGCGATGEPVAKFEYKADGLEVNFTDQSTDDGKIVKWDWKFGDGKTSSEASPVHAYAAAGKYTVVLTVTDDSGKTGTAQQEVTVTATGEAPKAAFEFKVDGREVNFNDTSTDDGKIVKWEWKFGDGKTSSEASPVHTYAADGSYTVVLTVTDDSGQTGSAEQKVQVGAGGGIDAKFEYKVDGLEVNFTDQSSAEGKIVKWDWKFGDGGTSTDPSPIHKYGSPGNYTVIFTVTDDSGKSDTEQQVVKVGGDGGSAPTAGFEFKVDGFEVNFNDTSTDDGKIVAWSWDFGDGDTSRAPSPLKKYGQKGVYKVRLTVTDDEGLTGTAEQSVTIGSGTDLPPVPSFEFKIDGASVNFNDTSTDPDGKIVGWKWSFGDGSSSTDPSPVHTYKANGNYKVVLEVTDDSGNSATVERTVQITALDSPPTAGFSFKAMDLQVAFTDTSKDDGKLVSWNWDFGDGNSSEQQNPVHSYAKAGEYTVVLSVRDDAGQKGEFKQVVKVTQPVDEVLQNGKPVKVSDGLDGRRYFRLDVPAGATKLQFTTSGGSGDVDLYVKFGAKPTLESYDCRPYAKGNAEACPMPEAKAGTWWVMLDGYRAYADVTLAASFEAQSDIRTYASSAPVAIIDVGKVESPIAVSGRDGAKGQAQTRVGVAITHSYIGDLRVSLVAPSGKEFVLHNREGGSSDNIFRTYTVDLSAEALNGSWKLRVDDNSQGDTGSINAWSITF